MKIKRQEKNTIILSDMKKGEVFTQDNTNLYIKTSECRKNDIVCVNLHNGQAVEFYQDAKVEKVEAEITILA